MVNKTIQDDLLIRGKAGLSVGKIKTEPEKTLEMLGAVNVADSETGGSADISVAGVSLFDIIASGGKHHPSKNVLNITTSNTYTLTAANDIVNIQDQAIPDEITVVIKLPVVADVHPKSYTISLKNYTSGLISINSATGELINNVLSDGTSGSTDYDLTQDQTIEIHSDLNNDGGGTDGWTTKALDYGSRKTDVRVATTANITVPNSLYAGQTIDGVTLAHGDLVLVKDQSTATQNGVYMVKVATAPRYPRVGLNTFQSGSHHYVTEGTVNAKKNFVCTNTKANSKVGTHNLVYEAVDTDLPAGSNTQIQFNNNGAFGGSADMTWDGTSLKLTDNKDLTLGTDDDLVLKHTGSAGTITNITGTLAVSSGGALSLTGGSGSAVTLTSDFGNLTIDAQLADIHLGPSSNSLNINTVTNFDLATDSSSITTGAVIIDGGVGIAKNVYIGQDLHLLDNKYLKLGTGEDILLGHDAGGDGSVITNSTGDFSISNTATTSDMIFTLGDSGANSNFIFQNNSGTDILKITANKKVLFDKTTITQITSETTSVTLNASFGTITTVSVTTAAGGSFTFNISNNFHDANSVYFVSVIGGTNSQGTPVVTTENVTAGTIAVTVNNIHASLALNGTLLLGFIMI